MTARVLTAADVGRELGRTADWVHRHWHDLVAEKKIPEPILDNSGHVTWSAAQFYAFLDRKLTRAQRAAAAAYRIALDSVLQAAEDTDDRDDIARDRAVLDQRFAGRG